MFRPLKACHMILIRQTYHGIGLYVLGGSTYAVVTAVRLSRKGDKVFLVHPGRRLGLFPFVLLSQGFFEDMGIDCSKHCEAEITEAELQGRDVDLAHKLHVCRTTPLFEELVSRNEITVLTKPLPSTQDDIVNCIGTKTSNIYLRQTLRYANSSNQNLLKISFERGSKITLTAYFKSLAFETAYERRLSKQINDVLAYVERPSEYIDHTSGMVFPALSFLGPDHAEWHPDRSNILFQAEEIIGVVKGNLMNSGGRSSPAELRFL